jgi:hypothetical protein
MLSVDSVWLTSVDDPIAKVAWTAKIVNVNQLALTVYDVLVGSFNGGGLSPEQWYIKVRLVFESNHLLCCLQLMI